MKKHIIIIAFGIISLIACTNNDTRHIVTEYESNSQEQAYANLMNELNEYNSTFQIETKAGGFWRRLGRIALADCLGFAGGSLLGPGGGLFAGVMNSFFAFCAEVINANHYVELTSIPLSDDVLYSKNKLTDFESCDYIGEMHNMILCEIYDNDPTCFETYTDAMLAATIKEKVQKYYPNEEIVCTRQTIADSKEMVNLILEPNNDVDHIFEVIKAKIPTRISELDVIKNYCISIDALDAANIDLLEDYTEGYREIIIASDLDDDSKEFIQSNISVAGNSQILWSEAVQ